MPRASLELTAKTIHPARLPNLSSLRRPQPSHCTYYVWFEIRVMMIVAVLI